MGILDGGKGYGGYSNILGGGATRQVGFHVSEGEGAVRVEGDAARSGGIKFAINEVAGFARGGGITSCSVWYVPRRLCACVVAGVRGGGGVSGEGGVMGS